MLYAAMYAATSSASHFMSSRDVMGEFVTGSMAIGATVGGAPLDCVDRSERQIRRRRGGA